MESKWLMILFQVSQIINLITYFRTWIWFNIGATPLFISDICLWDIRSKFLGTSKLGKNSKKGKNPSPFLVL